MSRVALWAVEGEQPTRLAQHRDFLESHLETWVERDPSLVMDGLKWIGRQTVLPDRTRLDLLGITPEGQWVVAELKAGPVSMGTLTQALHYAMHVGSMDADDLVSRLAATDDERDRLSRLAFTTPGTPRPVVLLLVGTSQESDVSPGLQFLQRHGLDLAVRIVTFGLFKQDDGRVFLTRDVDEQDDTDASKLTARSTSVQRVLDLASQHGVESELKAALDVADRLGLRVKPWPMSITINSPANWRKTLLYFSPTDGGMHVGYSGESLDEAFGATEAETRAALGENWVDLSRSEFKTFLERSERYIAALRDRAARAQAAADSTAG